MFLVVVVMLCCFRFCFSLCLIMFVDMSVVALVVVFVVSVCRCCVHLCWHDVVLMGQDSRSRVLKCCFGCNFDGLSGASWSCVLKCVLGAC